MEINLSFNIIIKVWEGANQNWVSAPFIAETNLLVRLSGNSGSGHRVIQLKFVDIIKQACDRKSFSLVTEIHTAFWKQYYLHFGDRGLPPISSSWRQAPWDPLPTFFSFPTEHLTL
jgi:hypothetical protein